MIAYHYQCDKCCFQSLPKIELIHYYGNLKVLFTNSNAKPKQTNVREKPNMKLKLKIFFSG